MTTSPGVSGAIRAASLVAIVACGRVGYDARRDAGALDAVDATADAREGAPVDGRVEDGGADASALPLGPFGAAVSLTVSSPTAFDDDPAVSPDGLELYFSSERPGVGAGDIWRATRAAGDAPWSAPELVTQLSTATAEGYPALSSDALTMWLAVGRDIRVATRLTRTATWSAPSVVSELAIGGSVKPGAVFAGDLQMVFETDVSGSRDLYLASRPSLDAPWTDVRAIAEINTPAEEGAPHISSDGLDLWFHSDRPGSLARDIWRARRAALDAAFEPPVRVDELATAADELDPCLTADQRYIVFSRSGDVYAASR